VIKVAFFHGEDEYGPRVIPLFGPADPVFEKTAAPTLLPEVAKYIAGLRPQNDSQYVLLNAMGASEWWGSNINGDAFTEASLIHRPDEWSGNPLVDKPRSTDWPYGFPTFYFAHPYAHHRNKDAARAFGDVELAAWHPKMKRVELVTRVDKDKCQEFGGTGVWDKLRAGELPDVSMGCFKAGAQVTMADGTRKPIEDVVVDDRVRTHTGGVGRVTELHRRRYRGEFFEIQPANEDSFIATQEHPFWAAFNSKDPSRVWRKEHPVFDWVGARDLDGAVLAHPKITTEAPSEITTAWARLIGYYLAEGHVVFNKKDEPAGIELTVGAEDAIHDEIERLCAEIGTRNMPVWRPRENSCKAFAIGIYDPEVAERCAMYAGRFSKTKRLAEAVLYWPTHLQLNLIGAYLNGDGFSTATGLLCASTSSQDLVHQLRELLFRLGIPTSYQLLHHKAGSGFSRTDTDEWVVSIGRQWAPRFEGYCAKVRVMQVGKSKNVLADFGDLWAVPIRALDSFYDEDDVYNFEVEGDNSYLVNGVAVHNCKVPFDTCSICLDKETYRRAQQMFNSSRHRSPGDAVLAYHKELIKKNGKGIRGVSITRKDYCEHAGKMMNHILPDGRKVFVYNDYPKFFDISFVFIGADKTAKVMMKIAGGGKVFWFLNGAELAEKLGYGQDDDILMPEFAPDGTATLKVASVSDETLKHAFLGKLAKNKDAEITKDVVPSQFAGKAVPLLTQHEKDLPKSTLDALGTSSLEEALSTPTGLGMVLRPHEFQRIILIQMGKQQLADELDSKGEVFPKSEEKLDVPMGPRFFSQVLARLLLPMMSERSGLGPVIERRVLVATGDPKEKRGRSSSLSNPVLRKMGAAYNGYRTGIMELVAHAPELISSMAMPSHSQLTKLASAPVQSVFTPLSASYFKLAFMDEVTPASVERGFPSRNTSAMSKKAAGGY
jgi:hypothetical protein